MGAELKCGKPGTRSICHPSSHLRITRQACPWLLQVLPPSGVIDWVLTDQEGEEASTEGAWVS